MGGTETRQRHRVLSIRLSPEEKTLLSQNAARAGLPLGSYVRSIVLGAKPPRQVRRPPVEFRAVAEMLGHVGKIGSNVNQIARQLNSDQEPERNAITEAALAVTEMREVLLRAMGREP